jgi:hypothetical protein
VKAENGEVVFLVRMWRREGEHVNERDWRGSIHEIESGLRFYVTDARDIADFIGARLAEKSARGEPR